MRKIVLSLSVLFMIGCHDHSDDKILGNMKTLYRNKFEKEKIHIIDSMRLLIKKTPQIEVDNSWYAASELNLPAGTVIGFYPNGEAGDQDGTNGKGPYYVKIKDNSGKINLRKIDFEMWWLLRTGDILK